MILSRFRKRTWFDGVKYAEQFYNDGRIYWPDCFDFSGEYGEGIRNYIEYREDILDNL